MPYELSSEAEIFSRLRDLRTAYEPALQQLGLYTARAACYYEGIQWIYYGGRGGSPRLGRLLTNWDSDPNRPLRITANRITRMIQKLAAQTEPSSIGFDIAPPDRDPSPEAAIDAQVKETILSAMIDSSSFLACRKEANFKRTIFGDYPIMLSLEPVQRDLGGEMVQDWQMRCRTFDPTQIIVDPGQPSRDLRDHDEVWVWDIYTEAAFRRKFPQVAIDSAKLKTVGELAKVHNEIARISDGRLYGHIKTYSKTKGVMVYQGHYKGYSGRWDQMFVVAEIPGEKSSSQGMLLLNDGTNPFGGDGFPIAKYSGARRASGPFSISDVWQMVDDQDRLNLMESHLHRYLQKFAGFKVFVDLATLKAKGAKEDFRNQWNNQVGGAVFYDTNGLRGPAAPAVAQMPTPPPFLADMAARYQDEMERQVHRPEITFGAVKSHVPDRSYTSAIEQADQVGNVRIKEDVREDARFLTMMLGTALKLAKQGAPSIVGAMRRAGLDEQDFLTVVRADDTEPGTVTVRESSVRNRSPEGRRNDLNAALLGQAIDPVSYRQAVAADLDLALTNMDSLMEQAAQKEAMEVLLGKPYQPLPLGEFSKFFIDAFRKSLFDRRAKYDLMARQRLIDAIQLQEAAQMATQAALAGAQPADGQQAQTPQTMTLGEALAAAAS